jgi:thioredoxin reductase (NADPH)
MQKMKQQSLSLGARILTQTVTKVDFTEKPFKIFTEKETFLTESVIIATGAKPKTLNLP